MVKVLVAPGRLSMILRMVFASLGISAGLLVGIYFIKEKNAHVIIWGFLSAIFALEVLVLHVLYKRERLRIYADKLRPVMVYGLVGQAFGFVALVTYIVLGIVFRDDLKDMSWSYFVASVWGFMTWKWAFALTWYAREYRLLLSEEALIPVGGEDSLYVDSDQSSVVKPPDVTG